MRLRIAAALAVGVVSTGACAQVIGADFSGFSARGSTGGAAGINMGAGGDSMPAADGAVGSTGGGSQETGGASGRAEGGGGAAMGGASGGGASGGAGGGPGGAGGGASGGGGSAGGADGGSGGSGGQALADAADGPARDGPTGGAGGDVVHEGGLDDGSRVDAARDGAEASAGTLVINEIRAVDQDWLELYNPGSDAVDLGGRGLTQAQSTNGPPDPTALLSFPAGTSLAAGAFLFVLGKQTLIGGPFTACGGLASSCYWVDWGVSASGGEAVYLVLTPSLAIVETVTYPLTNAPPAGRSYGRFPDGTGPFMSTAPTPNAANQF